MLYKLGVGSMGADSVRLMLEEHGFTVVAIGRTPREEPLVWVKCNDPHEELLLSIVAPGTVSAVGLPTKFVQQTIEVVDWGVYREVWEQL